MGEWKMGGLSDFYFALEDRYYEVLDKINQTVPIYSIIDPIDKVFPSFILFIIFALVLLLLIGSVFAGDPLGIGKLFAGGSSPAIFKVVDSSNFPLASVQVSLVLGTKTESKTTDSFGEFQTAFYGKGVAVSAKQKGFSDFSDKIDIAAGKKYTIKLQSGAKLTTKKIDFELSDEDGGLILSETIVSMDFACSAGPSPSGFTKNGPRQSVSVQSNCGNLTATISATSYEDARKTIDAALQQGKVEVTLRAKAQYGQIRVKVFDEDNSKPIEGAELTLKSEGRTVLRLGTSDATGSVLADHIPSGNYYVEAVPKDSALYFTARSNDFDMGAAQFSDGGPTTIEVPMRKALAGKKILLKFIDAATKAPVAGVKTILVTNNLPTLDRSSAADGTVEFINLDAAKKYSAIASHPEYVLQVVSNIALVNSSETSPTLVTLAKSVPTGTGSNSGTAKVIVTDSSGGIAGANTWLYSGAYTFALNGSEPVQTGAGGIAEYKNLPAGSYKATASKTIGGTPIEGTSASKSLAAGGSIELPIQLVTADGKIEVLVLDHDGRVPLADANVHFVDKATGQRISRSVTKASGLTDAVDFRADKRIFVIVEKAGYYRTTSVDYGITPKGKRTIEVVLEKVGSPLFTGDFDVGFVDAYDSEGRKVSQIDAGRQYVFRFKLHALKSASQVKAIARAGPDFEPSSDAGNIYVLGTSPSSFITQASYSKCFNPANIYADCPPQDPATGSKQVVASFSDLDPDVAQDYEFEVLAAIRDKAANNSQVELHYGGKAKVNNADIFVLSAAELKVVKFFIGRNSCANDCALRFEAAYQDTEKKSLPSPANANLTLSSEKWVSGTGSPFELLKGAQYRVDFNFYNDTRDGIADAHLKITSDNGALAIPTPDISLGSMVPGAKISGSFNFTAQSSSGATGLDMNLGLGKKGDVAKITFRISEDRAISVALKPGSLPAGVSPLSFDVNVFDSTKAQVAGADVFVYGHATGAQVVTNPAAAKTGTDGAVSITLERTGGFSETTVLDVNVRKTGFRQASAQMPFTIIGSTALLPGLECVTDETGAGLGSKYIFINQRNGSGSFTVKNSGCARPVDLNFSKHPESDIGASYLGRQDSLDGKGALRLLDNEAAVVTIKAGKVFGVQPIFITARANDSSGRAASFDAGTVRAVVTNPAVQNSGKMNALEVCLGISRPAKPNDSPQDSFTFNFETSTKDALTIINKCFSGQEDSADSSNLAANRFPQTGAPSGLLLNTTVFTKDGPTAKSGQQIEVTKTGEIPKFFIVTQQDYVKGGG